MNATRTKTIETIAPSGERVWLRRFCKLVCFSTLLLIFAGGLVKSHDAGLSVPDWPNSYGQNMFLFPPSQWVGNIFYEHTHRLIASSVGFMTLILAVWLTLADPRRWVKTLGWCALGAVIAQGVLGGLTVLFLLPASISVAHGVLAQTFFVITIVLAYSQSRERRDRERFNEATNPALGKWALIIAALVYIQLILGAVMRHSESGLAIPDFPATGGHWLPWFDDATLASVNGWRFEHNMEYGRELPPVTMSQVVIHFIHRFWALVVTVAIGALTYKAVRGGWASGKPLRTVYLQLGGVLAQFSLGALTVWTHKAPNITSLHVVTGAGLLGVATLLSLRALPVGAGQKSGAASSKHVRVKLDQTAHAPISGSVVQ
ncbi:MAG: COX15/CtaA family protein [Candidatus Hydrogenedentes bacterium]|nr:COX15/CtaA family protein [Candidatus Hydrogenedentota bacterium]